MNCDEMGCDRQYLEIKRNVARSRKKHNYAKKYDDIMIS